MVLLRCAEPAVLCCAVLERSVGCWGAGWGCVQLSLLGLAVGDGEMSERVAGFKLSWALKKSLQSATGF